MILSVKRKKVSKEDKKFNAFHLSRPLPLKEIVKLAEIKKTFTMSPSTFNRLSKKVKAFLENKKIKIRIIKKAGRPLSFQPNYLKQVIDLYNAGLSFRKIEKKNRIAKKHNTLLSKKSKKKQNKIQRYECIS